MHEIIHTLGFSSRMFDKYVIVIRLMSHYAMTWHVIKICRCWWQQLQSSKNSHWTIRINKGFYRPKGVLTMIATLGTYMVAYNKLLPTYSIKIAFVWWFICRQWHLQSSIMGVIAFKVFTWKTKEVLEQLGLYYHTRVQSYPYV